MSNPYAGLIRVDVRCRNCGATWLAALIDPKSWWGKGATPANTAKQVICECGSRVETVTC